MSTNARPLVPHGGCDDVTTPAPLAGAIISHFRPTGSVLDPCSGSGAFYNQYPWYCAKDRCEIKDGRDFLAADFSQIHFDWIITNPPWSQMRKFLRKSMEAADNVVFLSLVNAFFMKARMGDMENAGFAIKEILFVPTPPRPWPQTGFLLGAVHLQKNFQGPITTTKIKE